MGQPAKLADIVDALEMADESFFRFLDRRTGEVSVVSNEEWRAAENNDDLSDYPEWEHESILKAQEIQSSEHFVGLPSKFEINDYEIMERFSHEYPNQRISERLSVAIRGSGAFRRFREKIVDLNIEDDWRRYQLQAYENLAIEWLESEKIPFTRAD